MKQSFIFLIKFMPVIQMAGIFIANILFYFNVCKILVFILSFLLGNSLIISLILLIANRLFGFCKWHRIIIVSNCINILIDFIDKTIHIPISNLELLMLYSFTSIFFLIIALIYKFKCKKYETSIEDISQRITQCCR